MIFPLTLMNQANQRFLFFQYKTIIIPENMIIYFVFLEQYKKLFTKVRRLFFEIFDNIISEKALEFTKETVFSKDIDNFEKSQHKVVFITFRKSPSLSRHCNS